MTNWTGAVGRTPSRWRVFDVADPIRFSESGYDANDTGARITEEITLQLVFRIVAVDCVLAFGSH
jgi:hypothetical protein